MFKKKIKATIVDAEIDHEITYPHELNEDYMNNCLNDSGIPSFIDDGSVDLQVHYTRLVIKYYINGKEHTEKISNCYMDRAVRKGETINVVYNLAIGLILCLSTAEFKIWRKFLWNLKM